MNFSSELTKYPVYSTHYLVRRKVLNCIYKKESLIDVIVKIWALSRAVLSHDKLDPVAVKKKKKKYRYSLTQSPRPYDWSN